MNGNDPAVLAARLESADRHVRRVAASDLGRLAARDERAAAALASRLAREDDEAAAIAIARALGRARDGPARGMLLALYEDRRTPARVAHAAILAHDAVGAARSQRFEASSPAGCSAGGGT